MNMNVRAVTLVKGKEKYIFVYDLNYKPELLKIIGQFASDPALSLSWYDAAILSSKVRKQRKVNLQ